MRLLKWVHQAHFPVILSETNFAHFHTSWTLCPEAHAWLVAKHNQHGQPLRLSLDVALAL